MKIFKQKINLITDVLPKLRTPKKEYKQISKKFTFRGLFEKQHVKGDQTLCKSERHHLYHIHWSLWRQLSRKKSLLVIWKVLRMFVNILTANDKYFLRNKENLRQPIQMQLSLKDRTFSQFVSEFLKWRLNFELFQKRVTLIADQTLLKAEWHHFYHIYWSLWRQLSRKKSFLVLCKVLRMFFNILTSNNKYSLLNGDNLRHPIRMQLSQKEKTFSQFFSAFLKCRLSFEQPQKKISLIVDVFPKLRTPKNFFSQISKKFPLRGPFDKQHVRGTKHCWNLNHTTFAIFIDHFESSWVGKNLS